VGQAPLLDGLVTSAAALRASDLHLADGELPCVRVDGRLHRLDLAAGVDVAATLALGEAERARVAAGESIDLGRDVEGAGRVRIHVFLTSEGFAAAVRLLPRAAPSLASLHLPLPIDDLAELPAGLVLVCGATGSGKSTTLAALAQEALRRRSIVLATLEDPIEFALSPPETSLVRRRQVGRDVRAFAAGLRDALREDPDVLLLGEMRDAETIGLALTAAETGHLVLSSLHSRSAASAIERIVDAYPPTAHGQIRSQLADSLRAVVVQRLLPRVRGDGRVLALEILRVNHAVGALIRDGKTSQVASTLQAGKREGMLSLERCLADKVQAGEVRLEDARAAANEPGSLAMYLAAK
jgi:twitching motility protein PilT